MAPEPQARGSLSIIVAMLPGSSAHSHPQGVCALLRQWELLLLALATALIAGVLIMHGFSVGHHTPVEVRDQHAHATASHADPSDLAGSSAASLAAEDPCPPLACGGADAMLAMCVFMLMGLVFVVPKRRGSSWRWFPPWLLYAASHPPQAQENSSDVSLTRLCISRT